jgi:O-antigen ligase
MTYADAVKLGFIVGVLVFLAALAWPRWINQIMGVAITIGILTAPLIPSLLPNPLVPSKNLEFFSPSSAHRILIWKNTAEHIKQKLFIGSGLDATRGLYTAKDRIIYDFPSSLSNGAAYSVFYEPIPLHPHNAILQLWLELGAVGALIGLGLLLAILRSIRGGRLLRMDQAVALGLFSTTLTLASISFGIWQGWWLSSILLISAYFISLSEKPTEKDFNKDPMLPKKETGGPKGLDPTRYGDWERKGRAIDF